MKTQQPDDNIYRKWKSCVVFLHENNHKSLVSLWHNQFLDCHNCSDCVCQRSYWLILIPFGTTQPRDFPAWPQIHFGTGHLYLFYNTALLNWHLWLKLHADYLDTGPLIDKTLLHSQQLSPSGPKWWTDHPTDFAVPAATLQAWQKNTSLSAYCNTLVNTPANDWSGRDICATSTLLLAHCLICRLKPELLNTHDYCRDQLLQPEMQIIHTEDPSQMLVGFSIRCERGESHILGASPSPLSLCHDS